MKLEAYNIVTGLTLICLSVVFAFGEDPFFDNFDRADGKPGNSWVVNSPEMVTEIKNKEILIHGTEKTDWKRNGLERAVNNISKICFDFLNKDKFNVHLRVDDGKSGSKAYMDIYSPPGGNNFNYASSKDGGWPGWTKAGGADAVDNPRKPGYRQLCLQKTGNKFKIILDGSTVTEVTNEKLTEITKVFISIDAAASTIGSMHVDNVDIDNGAAKSTAVNPREKLSTTWSHIKKTY